MLAPSSRMKCSHAACQCLREIAHRIRRRATAPGNRSAGAVGVATASAGFRGQRRVAAGGRIRRSRRRCHRRSHAGHARAGGMSVSAPGHGELPFQHRPQSADAHRGRGPGQAACGYQLLLVGARACARATGHDAERAVSLRRPIRAHGYRRMLDLRYLASAYGTQSGAYGARPPGDRYAGLGAFLADGCSRLGSERRGRSGKSARGRAV